jgi:pimeloyl-ACP methyl ester carboxylesterase
MNNAIEEKKQPIAKAAKIATGAVGAVAALPFVAASGWILYSNAAVNHKMPLPKAIDAERHNFFGKTTGHLSVYRDTGGSGRPLLLLHSVNAAASAYEMRPLFEHYRGARPVWALDLPGFGFSERTDRVYTPMLYEHAILDTLDKIGEPADVIALSLGCEFAARAALAHPEGFHSLTLISPSGFNPREGKRASQRAGQQEIGESIHRALAFPLWARPLFDLIATKRSIEFFLSQSFVGEPDPGMIAYDYISAHQPGAEHAPLYFLSGQLFTRDVRERIYAQVTIPTQVLYDRDAFVSFEALPAFVEARDNWHATRITPTLGLPHFEKLDETVEALGAFWG